MRKSEFKTAKEKLYQHFEQSPELSKILKNFPKILLRPIIFRPGKKIGEYLWTNNGHFIEVSVDSKTLKVLPEDPEEQKYLLVHEIGHSKSRPEKYREHDKCKTHHKNSVKYHNCLFVEILDSEAGYRILKKLNLLNSVKEADFWRWVLEIKDESPFPQCILALQRKTCIMKKQLNLMLKKLEKKSAESIDKN